MHLELFYHGYIYFKNFHVLNYLCILKKPGFLVAIFFQKPFLNWTRKCNSLNGVHDVKKIELKFGQICVRPKSDSSSGGWNQRRSGSKPPLMYWLFID